jgi:uncharacterized membrane protein YqiK
LKDYNDRGFTPVTIAIVVVGILVIVGAFWFSKRAEGFGREYEEAEAVEAKNPDTKPRS